MLHRFMQITVLCISLPGFGIPKKILVFWMKSCFRSLMMHLSEVSNDHLQQLTDATSKVYDGLYDSVGNKADDVNDRTMLYLTMRYNRRIIQNAAARVRLH